MKQTLFLIICLLSTLHGNECCVAGLTPLDCENFAGVKPLHLTVDALPNGGEMERELAHAKKSGATVSLVLSNPAVVSEHRARLLEIIPPFVDILFANEEEAYALTRLPPQEAASFLKNFCQVAVVKMGGDGCWVCSKEGLFHSPAEGVDDAGAGAHFAAAFLYAYLREEPLPRCAYLGNLTQSAAREQPGGVLSSDKWGEVLHTFSLHSN